MKAITDSRKEPRNRKWSPRTRRNFKWGMIFISLWLIGFLVFNLYPMLSSIYISLHEYHVKLPSTFIGLANYTRLFQDPLVVKSLWNTVYMVVFQVSISLFLSFFCAVLLNLKIKGQSIFRVLYFLPSIVPTVASTILFIWILNPNVGILNNFLQSLGIPGPDWFNNPLWAKPALIMLGLWGMGQSIMIYLSGLQDVPISYIEAAEIDGASWFQRLRYITIPMVSPLTMFMLIIGVIGMFQYFTQAYIFASAGSQTGSTILGKPLYSTLFFSVYLYYMGFQKWELGYASALAWVLFIIIMICTLLLLRWSKKWTYYSG
ncbi:MAG: carbohydrate ABC transporter permease [Acidobacteriaceae bacterium]